MRTFAQKQNQPQKPVFSSLARPNRVTLGRAHHEHPILYSQRTIGNQAVLRMLQSHTEEPDVGLTAAASPHFGHDFSRIPIHPPTAESIQTKLAVNKPGDEYEQEADHISEQVMRMSEPQLQRAFSEGFSSCQKDQCSHDRLQAKSAPDAKQTVAMPVVRQGVASSGQSMDPTTRKSMELRFGQDFSQVRVHTDASAASSARAVNALAYTFGHDITFADQQYAPTTTTGQKLLAHELVHVLQQQTMKTQPVIQRQEKPMEGEPKKDEETLLGERLWREFPEGVNVAFYADPEPAEAKRKADEWATRENAIGPKGKKINAKDLIFGKAISDTLGLAPTLTSLGKVLTDSVAKAPMPAGTVPNSGISPAKVRNLALFSHGTSGWCGLGTSITTSSAAATVKSIAPTLAANINVILYACNTGRGQSEAEEWVKGTMEGGGADSVSGAVRDALLAEGMKSSTVWGHTTTGHISRNFALRQFTAASGKGAAGLSYVSTYIFTDIERAQARTDLQQAIMDKGYAIDNPEKFVKAANLELTGVMYNCYADASTTLDYQGAKLGETAPVHSVEVASIVRDHWSKIFWPAHKAKSVDRLINLLKLKPNNPGK